MNVSTPRFVRLSHLLTMTLLSTSLGMIGYEAAKTFFLPNLEIWESHAITIVFTTLLATVVAFFVFRKLTALTRQRQVQSLCAEQIVSHAAEGILTINKRGQVLSLNPAAEKLFGYRAADVLNEPITKLLADPPASENRKLMRDTLPVGTILGLATGAREVIGKRKKGDTIALELTGSSMTIGDEVVSIAFARDISKRKRAQRYLTAHYAATCILAEARSLDEALPHILESICEALCWEVGAYWRFDSEAGVLSCGEIYQSPLVALPKLRTTKPLTCKLDQGLAGRACSTRAPVWIEDILATADCPCLALADPFKLHGAFAFPIMLGQNAFGIITFFSQRKQQRDARLLEVMAELAKQLGHFIARKRDEENLQQSEQRFRQLAENIHEVFWLVDSHDNRVLYLSPSFEEVWGRPCLPVNEQADSLLAFVHSEDRDRVLTSWKQQKLGQNTSAEYRIARPDGSVRWVWDRAFSIRDKAGQVYRAAGVVSDITDRKLTEEALRETTQTLHALVQAAPVGIYSTDSNGSVRLWNPAAARIFGWLEADILGQQLPLVQEGGHDELGGGPSPVLPRQSHHGQPTRCRKKDGTVIEVSLSSAPLRDTAGAIIGVMGILMDLTEQKKLEDQLRQAQKMEAVGQLAGGVAHDFNNLLTIIIGFSEILLGKCKSGELARHPLEQIQKAGERAAALTRQLLAFGRKQVLQVQALDLNAVVKDLGKMLPRLIGEDIELLFRLDPLLGRVKADPVQIEQILLNLAVNARDAMLEGGLLTITTTNFELGKSASSAPAEFLHGNYTMLAVSDTGCGMDKVTQARVFEPFFTTKEIGKGTGLGLATVYGIVKQSGGHIEVDSVVGLGTTLRIYLPQLEEADLNHRDQEIPSAIPQGNETLLLVEDEEPVRKLINHALQLSGYTVLEAGSGAEALTLWEKHKDEIALLVTDVIMPKMNGRQLAELATSRKENLRVLFISGYTDRVMDNHGILPSGTAFLQKPISPRVLAQKVREVLDAPPSKEPTAGPSTNCSISEFEQSGEKLLC